MALTHVVTASLADYAGKSGTVTFYVPATFTLAQVQAFFDAMCGELDPITGAKITGGSVALALTLPAGLKASAVDNTDIERGVNWRCGAANTVYSHTVRTPAAMDAIVDGEDVVGTADTTDWETILLNGDATTAPSDPFGNDLTSVLAKRVTFRK